MSTALLFSGQGAQVVGMGKSLYEGSPVAKDLYDRAARILPFDLREVCFNGPAETLTETRVCQPALYVQGYAIAEILRERGKLSDLKACLGLSLGELTAYAFAGVWDFETGLRIVAERGRLMQQACEATKGGMAAVIGGSREDIAKLCAAFDIQAANFNCPGQVVISGDADASKRFYCDILGFRETWRGSRSGLPGHAGARQVAHEAVVEAEPARGGRHRGLRDHAAGPAQAGSAAAAASLPAGPDCWPRTRRPGRAPVAWPSR